jgi:hypothetical protein
MPPLLTFLATAAFMFAVVLAAEIYLMQQIAAGG